MDRKEEGFDQRTDHRFGPSAISLILYNLLMLSSLPLGFGP